MSGASVTGRICSWVEGNLDKDFTLEEMSEELNYSKFYMERVFKENTGTTIYRYVQGRRLEEAARKLACNMVRKLKITENEKYTL